MKQILSLILLFSFTLVGCTKDQAKEVLCDTGKTASGLISAQVAVQLDCKNVDAIRADIDAKLVDLKVCAAPAPAPAGTLAKLASPIGDAICKPVIDALAAGLLTQIPAAWGCSGGKITDDAKAKLLVACSKAL